MSPTNSWVREKEGPACGFSRGVGESETFTWSLCPCVVSSLGQSGKLSWGWRAILLWKENDLRACCRGVAVGWGCLACWCWWSVVHKVTGHKVEWEWVYFSTRSDLDSVLLLPPAYCVSVGEPSLAQLGFSGFIYKTGTMSSLLQGSQSCVVRALKGLGVKQLLGWGLLGGWA